jgi:hypothetical protein
MSSPPSSVRQSSKSEPGDLGELLSATPQEIDHCDVGRMNLLCAMGLPGSEELVLQRYLRMLDIWTNRIRSAIDASYEKFERNTADYENSPAYYRMLILTTVLQREFGIRYDAEKARKTWDQMPDEQWYRDASEFMIHGLLGPKRTGTCPSLPVLIVAIARRLGYPLKLALAPNHIFARWECPSTGERLNIECHGNGMICHPDDYYHEWPVRWPPELYAEEAHRHVYLRGLSPSEELAEMLVLRGTCLEAHGQFDKALDAYKRACERSLTHPGYRNFARRVVTKMGGGAPLPTEAVFPQS